MNLPTHLKPMSKKFYHGIMFHYFHNGKGIHKKTQGSIDKNQLSGIIQKIGRKNTDHHDYDPFFEY